MLLHLSITQVIFWSNYKIVIYRAKTKIECGKYQLKYIPCNILHKVILHELNASAHWYTRNYLYNSTYEIYYLKLIKKTHRIMEKNKYIKLIKKEKNVHCCAQK